MLSWQHRASGGIPGNSPPIPRLAGVFRVKGRPCSALGCCQMLGFRNLPEPNTWSIPAASAGTVAARAPAGWGFREWECGFAMKRRVSPQGRALRSNTRSRHHNKCACVRLEGSS